MPEAALEALTTAAIGHALDAATLRQKAIASNIANHATPGYVPRQVDFASQLEQARRTLEATGSLDAASLSQVKPQLVPLPDANGRPQQVHLDEQMAQMAENSVQYQTLLRALNRHFSILSTAVSDGKR
jgi:flagellar basal-body rod protein FlgB